MNIESRLTKNAFAASCFGMMFFGITMVALGCVLPTLSEQLALTTGHKATLAFTLTSSILVGSIIFGPVCDRYGHRALFLSSCFSVLLGITGIAFATSLHLLIVSYVLIGVGGGVLNGQTNTIVSDLYSSEKLRGARLSLLGAFYGVGAMSITLLVWLFGNHIDITYVLLAIAILLAMGTAFCFKVQFPAPKQPQSFPLRDAFRLLRNPMLVMLSLVLLFQSSIESVTNNLATTYFSHIEHAVLLLTVMMAALIMARFALIWIAKRMTQNHILYSFLSITVCGFLIMPFAQTLPVAMLAMVLVGFGISATYPVVLGHLGAKFNKLSGTAFGIAISIALAGSSVINAFVGGLLLNYYPYVMITAVLIMVILCRLGINRRKHTTKKN